MVLNKTGRIGSIGRKITALLLGAAVMAVSSSVAFAESVPQDQTIYIEREMGASSVKTWDGKSALEAGKSYVLKKNVTLSKKVEIPKGTTLTVNSGVKLTIGTKGSLYIRGTLFLKSNSTLLVSGKLYTYSGSKISDSGAIKLTTNKAAVTIYGTLTVNKTGTFSGTPKSMSLSRNAKVTINGKNTCKKLTSLVETVNTMKAIGNRLTTLMTKMMVDKDYYGAIKDAVPAALLKKSQNEYKAAVAAMEDPGIFADMSYEDFVNKFCKAVCDPLFEENGDVKSVKLEVTKITNILKTLTDEEKALFDGCGNITKAYNAKVKSNVVFDGKTSSEEFEVKMVYIGGKWYICGEIWDLT